MHEIFKLILLCVVPGSIPVLVVICGMMSIIPVVYGHKQIITHTCFYCHLNSCHIVSLDIKGALDKILWDGLLKHLWSMRIFAYQCHNYRLLLQMRIFLVSSFSWSATGGVWSPTYVCYSVCMQLSPILTPSMFISELC